MKKYYYIALAAVIFLAASIIGFGVYLNSSGENVIANRMANRDVVLKAGVVKNRDFSPSLDLTNVNMQTDVAFDVVSEVDGKIVDTYVDKNEPVKAGQALFRIENKDIPLKIAQAESALAKARASKEQYGNMYARYSRLMELDATSKEKLDESRAYYESAIAEEASAEAQLEQYRNMGQNTIVTAPQDGVVTLIYKNTGSFLTTGTPVCMLSDFNKMWFSCNLPDSLARMIRSTIGYKAHIISDNFTQKAYNSVYGASNGEGFNLTLHGIYPDLTVTSDFRRVVWVIDNSSGLLEPSAYEKVKVTLPVVRNVLSVNMEAMIDDSDDDVYVLKEDNTIELRKIKTGIKGDKYIEIIDGLKPGEVVITSGAVGLHDGMKVDVEMEDD